MLGLGLVDVFITQKWHHWWRGYASTLECHDHNYACHSSWSAYHTPDLHGTVIFFLLICFGATPGAWGLLLALLFGVIPTSARGTIWDTGG